MLSSNSASIINEFRDGTPDGAWTADILMRLMNSIAADFTGTMRIELDERLAGAEVQPPNKPNLEHDLPTPLTVVNRFAFMKPGDEGASGGYAMRIIGPLQITPNRDGDVALDIPDGTIVCDRLILGGTEVILEDC